MIHFQKELTEQGIHLNDLPPEIRAHIASFLDARSLSFFGLTNKYNLQIIKSLLKKQLSKILNIKLTYCHSAFFLYTDRELFACGENYNGNLGLGDIKRATFNLVGNIQGKIKQVVTDGKTTFVVTDEGLFGCGKNDSGQLGIGNTDQQNFFKKIENIKGSIQQVAQGSSHSLVLTDNGLYGCGFNKFGSLGFKGNNHITTFKQLHPAGKIKTVSTSCWSTFVLTDEGLFVCGENSSGQLGLGDRVDRFEFTKVKNLPASVVNVFAGFSCTFLQTLNGVYACGSNGSSLWLEGPQDRYIFTRISMIKGSIKQVISHATTNLIMSNMLYVFGDNEFRFVDGPTGPRSGLRCFFDFHPHHNLSVHAGWSHILVGSQDALYVGGWNNSGQVGVNKSKSDPFESSFLNIKDKIPGNIRQIMAWRTSTVILTDEGLYACGSNEKGELGLGDLKCAWEITKIENLPKSIQQLYKDYRLVKSVLKTISKLEAGDQYGNYSRRLTEKKIGYCKVI